MQKLKKIIRNVLIITLIIWGLIFSLRKYQDYKYRDVVSTFPEYMKDVTNIKLYPTDIKGVDVTYLDEGSLQGFRLIPQNKRYKGVVICYGGSEGSPNFEEATRLAKEGYETFALFMFGMKNQPKTLMKIPLEQFEDVLKYIDKNVEDNEPITVMGASKGAEYALNLASRYPEIENLILMAPASYTFSGLDFKDSGSSWIYQGKELPYIEIRNSSFIAYVKNIIIPALTKAPISYKETYESAVDKDHYNYESIIPVKDLETKILLLAGTEDAMWHSSKMADIIQSQKPNVEVHLFEGAGHIFEGNGILHLDNMRIKVGGTQEQNEKARQESIKIMNDFLKNHHQKESH